ncbi:MAG: hypothetical protein IJV00_09515 [Clostridia bacterium]|nr:hypothetical protein [Clostridia bacterium]
MFNALDFIRPTDTETLQAAVDAAAGGGTVVIPRRKSPFEPERDFWLLDSAVLLPSDVNVVLSGCTVKLSDRCRDNFFRSANCGLGIEENEPLKNISIRGECGAKLVGADRPRSTGDSGKTLTNPCPFERDDVLRFAPWLTEEERRTGNFTFTQFHGHSFGTDAGKEGESQKGDWRNIGILFACVTGFSIENLTIVDPHCWAISLEACSEGRVEKIRFDAKMSKVVDGMKQNIENQDGIDLRNGCHHIFISDISGVTGDDMVALTAIAVSGERPGGSLGSTHVMHGDWSRRDPDIHDVVIRNVCGSSVLCKNLRLLACNSHIHDIVADGIVSTARGDYSQSGTILIGDPDGAYGKNLPDGISRVTISNVITNTRDAIRVRGYLKDSVIANVVNGRPGFEAVTADRENALDNVLILNALKTKEN